MLSVQFIRCKISFSLIDSASMCLHGPRSSFHAPANEINFSDHSIDLVHIKARPAGGLNLLQLADILADHLTDYSPFSISIIILCIAQYYNTYACVCMCLHVYVLYHRQCACVPDLQ